MFRGFEAKYQPVPWPSGTGQHGALGNLAMFYLLWCKDHLIQYIAKLVQFYFGLTGPNT